MAVITPTSQLLYLATATPAEVDISNREDIRALTLFSMETFYPGFAESIGIKDAFVSSQFKTTSGSGKFADFAAIFDDPGSSREFFPQREMVKFLPASISNELPFLRPFELFGNQPGIQFGQGVGAFANDVLMGDQVEAFKLDIETFGDTKIPIGAAVADFSLISAVEKAEGGSLLPSELEERVPMCAFCFAYEDQFESMGGIPSTIPIARSEAPPKQEGKGFTTFANQFDTAAQAQSHDAGQNGSRHHQLFTWNCN